MAGKKKVSHGHKKTKNGMTAEEARRVLQEEERKRQEKFIAEYNELCKRYGLRLTVNSTLSIVAMPDQ